MADLQSILFSELHQEKILYLSSLPHLFLSSVDKKGNCFTVTPRNHTYTL